MEQHLFEILKELRGLKLMAPFCAICEAERIASRATIYSAVTPLTFKENSLKHRAVVRRAIRFLQTQGSLVSWVIDEVCPEYPPATAVAA